MDKELVAHIVEHVKLANGGDGDDGAEFEIESPAVMLRLELWGHEYLMQLGREVCGMTKIRSHGGQRRRFHAALHASGVARIASLYQQLAERVSLNRCGDRSFHDLRAILREWFPRQRTEGT